MLDMRTLMITFVINSLINTVVMAIYWRQNRKYFEGISWWVVALFMQTMGFLLLGIRGALPDFITIVVSNTMIVSASFLLYIGFKRLVDYQAGDVHNYVLVIIYFLLQYYFAFIQPSGSSRIILISIFTSLMFLQSGRLLLNANKHNLKRFTKTTGIICYTYILVQIYRIVVEIITPTTDYFNAGLLATLAQLINQFMTIAIVFSFIIMVNSLNLHNRLKNEEEMLESRKRTEELYNNAPCGYHSLDKNGKIISINDTELGWLGYKKDEVLGKLKLTDIVSPQNREIFDEHFPDFLKSGYQNDIRLELINKSGGVVPVILNSKAVFDDNHEFLYSLTTLFDRTEINRIEKELAEARDKANIANQAKTDFMSKMSHELRTPLNAIIALSGVLGRALASKITEDEYSYIEIIHRSGDNLLELINDILDISRIESGRVEIELKEFNLNNVILRLIDIMQPLADKKKIELNCMVFDKELLVVSDENKLVHILQNLVGNAIKFTDEGHVSISMTNTDSSAIISVKDTGIGIDETKISHIFDEFRQADQSITRRFGGTGLGLSIVRKYLEMLEGNIHVTSILGKGSEFVIEIPLEINKND